MVQEELKVLLVDDSEFDAMLVKKVFQEEYKVPVEWFEDGEDFIDYIKKQGDYAERKSVKGSFLVLLDLNMPRKDGFECLDELRNFQDNGLSDVPVMILSTSNFEKDVQKAHHLGANSYIGKPPTFQELKEVVSNLMAFWTRSATVPQITI